MVGLPCPTCVNQDKDPLCSPKNVPCGIVGCAPMLCLTEMENGTKDIWVGKLGETVPYDYGGKCGYAASCLGCIPNIDVWYKKNPKDCLAGCLLCPVKCLGSAATCGTSCCRPCQICCALTCGEACCKCFKCCKCRGPCKCNPCCECCHYGYVCKGPQCKCCSNEGGSCKLCRCWCRPNCCDYGYTPPAVTKGKMHRPKGTCPRCWAWWYCWSDCCPKCPKCPTCPKCCTCCPMLPPCCKGNVRSVGYQHQCDWDCGFAGCKSDITFLWSCCFLCGEIADLNPEGKFVPRRIHDPNFAKKLSVSFPNCDCGAPSAPEKPTKPTEAPKAETMA